MNRDARLGASVRRGRDADRPPRRIPEGIHARIGTGILTPKRTRLTWRLFRDPPAGRYEPMVLAFHGPAIPLLLVLTRSGLLASDAGLIMQPERGTGVRASSGETPTDLVAAVYPGGGSLLHRRRERFRAAYSHHQNAALQASLKTAHHRRLSFTGNAVVLPGLFPSRLFGIFSDPSRANAPSAES